MENLGCSFSGSTLIVAENKEKALSYHHSMLKKLSCDSKFVPGGIRKPTTIMILNFRTDRSGQTVQTQIRLLLEEQSDQGLHCLLFHLHVFNKIPSGMASLFEF